MSKAPEEQLSAHFSERMRGRRLVAAVFTTFNLDPGFFELEVLPVFLDGAMSHVNAVRHVQLEDALRSVTDGVAVYYDASGLEPGEYGTAKLDVARVPIRVNGGLFHPKNVFALIEANEPDEDGHRARSLLAGCASANLTRNGWWENVEVAHVEEIAEGEAVRLRDPLRSYLSDLKRRSPPGTDHRALVAIRRFLTRDTDQRPLRSHAGRLHPHVWCGPESLVDFLQETVGRRLSGMHMEVISPFFDGGGESAPLSALIDLVEPKSCRVFLPKQADGRAQVTPELYAWVRSQPNVEWGTLPSAVTQLGKSADAAERGVHAKVYRFFRKRPKEELLLVGSPNLTTAAHQHRGNVETAFFVEVDSPGRVDFWLEAEEHETRTFAEPEAQEELASQGGTRLGLRFDWVTRKAVAYWASKEPSPELQLSAQGSPLFILSDVPPDEWTELSAQRAERLEKLLVSTALVTVHGDGEEEGLLLVQETGMSDKPSLLFSISTQDILRYWSLLTAAQRAAFLERKLPELLTRSDGADLVPRLPPGTTTQSMFDRFAGIFHAFAMLEGRVRSALEAKNEREAEYRLFGQKYDSLGTLLEQVTRDPDEGQPAKDPVEQYLMALCAAQVFQRLAKDYPELWAANRERVERVWALQREAMSVRDDLLEHDPDGAAFLAWYEEWFLKHASEVKAS